MAPYALTPLAGSPEPGDEPVYRTPHHAEPGDRALQGQQVHVPGDILILTHFLGELGESCGFFVGYSIFIC